MNHSKKGTCHLGVDLTLPRDQKVHHSINIALTAIEDHCAIDQIVLNTDSDSGHSHKTIYYNDSQETQDCCDLDNPIVFNRSIPKIDEYFYSKFPYGIIILLKRKKKEEHVTKEDLYIDYLNFYDYWESISYPNPQDYLLDNLAEKEELEEFINREPKTLWYRLPLFVGKLEFKIHQIRNILTNRKDGSWSSENEVTVPDEDLELIISFCEQSLIHLREGKEIAEQREFPTYT